MEIHAKNLDELWEKTNWAFWNTKDEDFDFVRPGVTVHHFHNQLFSETAETNRNLADFGYTKTKWSMLLRLYFDPDSFRLAVNRLKMYRSEPKGKRFVVDVPIRFKERNNRSGECLIGMTVRFSKKYGWESEVFTRASEITNRWGVDLVFIHVVIREVGKHLGFTPKDVRVYWNSASMFQSILTTPLFLCLAGREDLLHKPPQTKWQADVQKRYQVAFATQAKYRSYKSQRRAVRAYQILKGEREAKHVLTPSELSLPKVDLTLPEDFFKKGGFK